MTEKELNKLAKLFEDWSVSDFADMYSLYTDCTICSLNEVCPFLEDIRKTDITCAEIIENYILKGDVKLI